MKQDKDEERKPQSGPRKGIDPEPPRNEEAILNDQDPGERQKRNQNKEKDDPLAA